MNISARPSRTLFNIGQDLEALEELLSEVGGEFTEDEAGQALEHWFDQLGEERDKKIDGYCVLIREFEARADARTDESMRLAALAATDAANAQRMKARLKDYFEHHGIKKLDTPRFKLWTQNNGGRPLLVPAAWEQNPASAPEAYHKRKIELDKAAIRQALEAGETIEGCVIGAPGTHLRIR